MSPCATNTVQIHTCGAATPKGLDVGEASDAPIFFFLKIFREKLVCAKFSQLMLFLLKRKLSKRRRLSSI